MKIKDMKVGELYLPEKGMKLSHERVKDFEKHVYFKKGDRYIDWSDQRLRYPINADFIHVKYNRSSDQGNMPLVYLGHTKEQWWLPRADWFPIRKRHWCMYKGRKMILDAWSAKNLVMLGEEND